MLRKKDILWPTGLAHVVCIAAFLLSAGVCCVPHPAPGVMSVPGISVVNAQMAAEWPMAAANPQRTSWSSEEVRGQLYPTWFKPFEAYIPPRVQIIAADGLLYISTAKGLYALNAESGDQVWVYPTEMPLGHSPTVHNGVAYVGGFDRRLHAINAYTGAGIWTFEAEAGFQTNPLVLDIDGHTYAYAGNRDGYMYAVEDQGTTASLLWRYRTGGPVLFSAAYKDGIIYFASNDAYAYALNARTGQLVWRSEKLLGQGFHSWWPVIYEDPTGGSDVVIFAGSSMYRRDLAPGPQKSMDLLDLDSIYPLRFETARGTPVGPRMPDGWIDATRITQYYEVNPSPATSDPDRDLLYKPWRRTYLVLDRATGQEHTFDTDGDGHPEYTPILTHHTQSGNRFPPVVGSDSVLYQTNNYMSDEWIAGGHVSGWRFGTPFISTPSARWLPVDEPAAYSAGGNLIYWCYWNGNGCGAFDISIPNTKFWDNGGPVTPDDKREWAYFDYNLKDLVPVWTLRSQMWPTQNLVHDISGDVNPPIPYQGRVYMHVANSVIAFGPEATAPRQLPIAEIVEAADSGVPAPGPSLLRSRLAEEIQKILEAGHLRPGYYSSGLFDGQAQHICGDNLADYWHNPADTLYTLIRALPYLPNELQAQTRAYLQSEFAEFPPFSIVHIGWRDGANRDDFVYPPEIESDLANYPPTMWSSYDFIPWGGADIYAKFPPYIFYSLWKYAALFGDARGIFDSSKARLEPVPSNEVLSEYPFVHNAYIAGYLGYLELEKLAGYSESSQIRAELDRLLSLRASTFSKDAPYQDIYHCRAMSIARNFMFLVPELGQYLHDHALPAVRAALQEYTTFNPYWFVSRFEATEQEGTLQILYDYNDLFQAKALVMGERDLARYLDVPAFPRGDLFYIQNLATAIEVLETPYIEKTVSPSSAQTGAPLAYSLHFFGTGESLTLTDTLPLDVSAPFDLKLQGTSITPVYEEDQHQLSWNDAPATAQEVTIQYTVTVITPDTRRLFNAVQLADMNGDIVTATALSIANPFRTHLPEVLRAWR